MIQHGLQWQQDMTHEAQLETLEHALRQYHLPLQEAIPQLAPILALSIPEERYPPLNRTYRPNANGRKRLIFSSRSSLRSQRSNPYS